MKHRLDKKAMRAAAVLLAAAVVFFAALSLVRVWEKNHEKRAVPEDADIYADDDEALFLYDGHWYSLRKDMETVLLIGLDKYSEDAVIREDVGTNHQQADFLMLLILDHARKTYTALHINRDTMTEVEQFSVFGEPLGSERMQITLSHAYGSGGKDSCRNTVNAVSDFLYGVPVDHYVCVTMDAVAELNDMVGGVTLELMDDFTAMDAAMVQGKTVTLNGEQAMRYCRARGEVAEKTNVHRMERQRQYLEALRDRATSCVKEDEEFLMRTAMELSQYMISDCTVNQLSEIASGVTDYASPEIQTIAGETGVVDGYVEFYADEKALQTQVVALFYEENE